MELLKFSPANAKLRKLAGNGKAKVYSLDLLAGHTCPFARECRSCAVEIGENKRKIKDGPHCQYRCYAASLEIRLPDTYSLHKHNTILLRKARTTAKMAALILASIPPNADIVRFHTSGDFFNVAYFRAVLKVVRARPNILFYGYTKAIPYLLSHPLPNNLRLTASKGGKCDDLITDDMRTATVVRSEYQARKMGLPVDHNDRHAAYPSGNFAIVVHGTQPPGSEYGPAVYRANQRKAKERQGR